MSNKIPQNTSTPDAERPTAAHGHRERHRTFWHRSLTLAAGLALAAGAVYLISPAVPANAFGLFGGPPPGCGRGPDSMDARDRAEMREEMLEHVHLRVDRMLDRIEADDNQREVILTIVDSAVSDLGDLHRDGFEFRKDAIEQLSAETVDRAALENLRARKLARFDQVSQRIVKAMADIADVLSLEQRRHIAEEIERRHG